MGRVMSDQNAAEMTAMMRDTVLTGTGKAAALADRPSAGKTGTSQDYRDAWFVGFTADLVCGVWIGNDDNAPMHAATGGGLPARVFHAFMTDAERGLPAKPLRASLITIASAAPASSSTADGDTATDPKATPAQKDLLDDFQHLLDKLF